MSDLTSITPFPLGAYLGNPDNDSVSAEATFEAQYNSFTSTMGVAPTYLDNYVDYTQPVDDWVGNASFQAASDAQSPDAAAMTPVIALPMASTDSSAGSADAQYQAIGAGDYDSVYKGILQAYVAQGYTNLVFRPGWEMNLQGPTYAGDTAQDQADWVAAYKQIYTVLHQDAAALGVNVTVVWNPSITNYTNANALTSLYPGNAYVDAIGADVYSDIYPYSDGTNSSGQPTYHDWDTGGEDTSVAAFIADPVNREHYWTYPAATEWSNDGSGGHSLSLDQLLAFAEQQGKPFAIPETGAGNSDSGTDVSDDAAFPQWLASQLTTAETAGEKIDFVNIWDSNGGGNYEFSNASDGKPQEAAAWAKYFGAQQVEIPAVSEVAVSTVTSTPGATTIGSGPDVLALSVAEDAWEGNANFTLSVDGTQIGGTQIATASQSAGQTQTFDLLGSFGAGSHTVSVDFLNDAYGGSSTADRNLYVDGATINGQTVGGSALSLDITGSQTFSFMGTEAPPTVVVGSGPDTLALGIDEDWWQANAEFTVSVDGTQIGGTQTTSAVRSAGQTQTFDMMGSFTPGNHTVSVDFLNDAYGGSSSTDRNLYVSNASIDGSTINGSALTLLSSGSQSFTFSNAAPAASDTLDLHMSEDAWQGDAEFTITINGTTIGGVHTASASHAAGATQDVALSGDWGANPTIGISFINDAYGGTPATDRNLYIDGATYDGQALNNAPATLLSNGTTTLTEPSGAAQLSLGLAEDAYSGDSQYSVAVDGKTLVQDGTVTALHAQGASQMVDLQDVLSPGVHDVAVSFLNDAYGGSPTADRNLYVTGLDVNGTAVSAATATLLTNGTQHFQIVVPAPS